MDSYLLVTSLNWFPVSILVGLPLHADDGDLVPSNPEAEGLI